MLFRSTVDADLDRVLACTVTEPVSWIQPDRHRRGLADRSHRDEWTWIAESGDRIVARAVWTGFPDADHPYGLDCVWVDDAITGADRVDLAAGLLAAAHGAFRAAGMRALPGCYLLLPGNSDGDPAVAAALSWRREAAARAGLTEPLRRLRYEWTPAAGVPEPPAGLAFRPEPDDEAFVAAFIRVAEGSLDVTTRRTVAAIGPERQAREDLDVYRSLRGERSWWRLAHTADGRLAGFAIPSRGDDGTATVGYLGVVPELRGNGYVHDLLAEITRFHAAVGAPRIMALTDETNLPMAAAFERAGYRAIGSWLILSEPPG
jgi:ribosomal protein S18 acetylase RimI-like enzyme